MPVPMPVLMSIAISSLVSVVSSGMFKKVASSLGSASGGTLSITNRLDCGVILNHPLL